MKVKFTCGKCGEQLNNMPKTNRLGDQVQCPSCGVWQPFQGSMQIVNIPGDAKIKVKEGK